MKTFFKNGHLTDEGIALYSEALRLDKIKQLPKSVHEHITMCDACHLEAMALYAIIAEKDYKSLGNHPFFEKQPASTLYIRLTYAALAVAASIFALLYFNTREDLSPSSTPNSQPTQAVVDSSTQIQPIQTPKAEIPQPEKKPAPAPPEQEQLALNFEISENLEGLVGEYTRSGAILVESPLPEAAFKVGQFISFAWQLEESEPIRLIIVNNLEKEILSLPLKTEQYQYKVNLPEGLYYWKLENEDDLLYVGKFFVR